MNRLQAKRFARLLALVLIPVLLLCACENDAQPSQEMTSVELPDPAPSLPRQILGDSSTMDAREVTLHYASEDSVSLTTVIQTIKVERDGSLIRNILLQLLDSESDSAAPNGPVEADLIGLEFGSGVATVNLSIDAGVNRSDQDYLLLCASIASTLLGVDGVEAVNILTGDRSDPVNSLPLGVFTAAQENVAAAYAQIQSEAQRFLDEGVGSITRSAPLYFPAQGGGYLLPEARELIFDDDDYVSAIIAALGEGPLQRQCCFSAIPGNLDLLASPAEIRVSDGGERLIHLNFSSMLSNYLAFAGVESWQLYGSLVLSLCSFVPEIDGVCISIDSAPVTECAVNGRTLAFEDGRMRREDFSSCIGGSAQLYFENEAGMLSRVESPMSQSAAASAVGLLSELISSPSAFLPGLRSVFPEGVAREDILGVTIENRTAIVNLSGNFYSRCQNLSPQQERLLIYAMVNTLTELSQIGAVSFLVEGEQLESLAQNIYLKTALMPDPGLVQDSAQEAPDSEAVS